MAILLSLVSGCNIWLPLLLCLTLSADNGVRGGVGKGGGDTVSTALQFYSYLNVVTQCMETVLWYSTAERQSCGTLQLSDRAVGLYSCVIELGDYAAERLS